MSRTMDELYREMQQERFARKIGRVNDDLRDDASARHDIHANHATHRPLSEDYELVGLAAERAFCEWAGITLDRELRPEGTRSINYTINGETINVYGARKPRHLLVEKGKNKADIHVLAGYSDTTGEARLIGWATKAEVKRAHVDDYGGMGIMSHGIDRRDLHKMPTLLVRLAIGERQASLFDLPAIERNRDGSHH